MILLFGYMGSGNYLIKIIKILYFVLTYNVQHNKHDDRKLLFQYYAVKVSAETGSTQLLIIFINITVDIVYEQY